MRAGERAGVGARAARKPVVAPENAAIRAKPPRVNPRDFERLPNNLRNVLLIYRIAKSTCRRGLTSTGRVPFGRSLEADLHATAPFRVQRPNAGASSGRSDGRIPMYHPIAVVPEHRPDASQPGANRPGRTGLLGFCRPGPIGFRQPAPAGACQRGSRFPPVPAGGTYAVATPADVLRWCGAPTQGPGAAAQSSLSSTRSCSV